MKHPLIIAGAVVAVIAINSASDSDSDGGTTYPTGPTAQTEVSFKAQVPIMDISPGGRWLLYVRVTNTGDTTSAPTCSVMAYDGDGYPLAEDTVALKLIQPGATLSGTVLTGLKPGDNVVAYWKMNCE